MTDGSALVLVRSAFPDAVEVIGAPDWASSEHFDVEARAAGPVTNDQMNGMLRSMLADRFKFVSHIETRERPVYVLMLARSDGRLGPGIRLYDGDCQAAADAARQGRARPQLPTPANGAPACGYSRGGRRILAGGITMAALARTISSDAERTVIDQTGLAGLYEFSLEISPDVLVFTVVREQLGLKLEPGRAPLPVLVIDRLERPTED